MGHVTQETIDLIRHRIQNGQNPNLNPAEFLELAKFWEEHQSADLSVTSKTLTEITQPVMSMRQQPLAPFTRAVLDLAEINTKGCRLYYSDRKIPLLYVDAPLDVPLITVENYPKWYSVFVIEPDGKVRKITPEEIERATDDFHKPWKVDHCFHPKLLFRLAKMLGGSVDNQAVEVAAGRWMSEINNDMAFEPEPGDE